MKKLTAKTSIILFALTACLITALTGCDKTSNEKKIGIIVPIEHKAMNEIVDGFTTALQANVPTPLTFKIANAEADMNMERAIIQQMKDEGYDIVVPIGTDATQMAAAMIQNQPIVSLASSLSDKDRKQRKSCNLAVVHDEISAEQLIQFVHEVYPSMHQLVLIHSASDKVFPEVKAATEAGTKYGISIKPMMVSALIDLYTTANNIPNNAEGILVLKDSLIVSGITTLEKTAVTRHLPLITSDQGSVQDGAGFALGVHEREIGVEGAKLAADVLTGKKACDLPIATMKRLTVFANPSSLEKQQQSLHAVEAAAKKLNITVEKV